MNISTLHRVGQIVLTEFTRGRNGLDEAATFVGLHITEIFQFHYLSFESKNRLCSQLKLCHFLNITIYRKIWTIMLYRRHFVLEQCHTQKNKQIQFEELLP